MHPVCKLHCFHQRHVHAMNMKLALLWSKNTIFPSLFFLRITHHTAIALWNFHSETIQYSFKGLNDSIIAYLLEHSSLRWTTTATEQVTCSQTVNCRLDSEDSTIDHRAGRPQPTPSFFGASRPLTDGTTSTGLYPQRNSRFSCTNFFTCQQKATCGQIILATPITPLYIISQHP